MHKYYFMRLKRLKEKQSYQAGEIFGRLVLTGVSFLQPMYGQLRRVVEATCECGVTKLFPFSSLTSKETQSCGCLRRDVSRERMTSHNLTNHPLFTIWVAMKQRCYNHRHKSYPDYGGRGIRVCDEWRDDFQKFHDWCIINGYKKGYDLDRRDNDGNYEPDNCRFVTREVSSRNTRRNKMITAFGETKCLFDWGKDARCAISVWGLIRRYNSGLWTDMEKMITTAAIEPDARARKMKNNVNLTAFGETKCFTDWLKDPRCLVKIDSLRDRLAKGWDAEKAISTPPSRNGKNQFSLN